MARWTRRSFRLKLKAEAVCACANGRGRGERRKPHGGDALGRASWVRMTNKRESSAGPFGLRVSQNAAGDTARATTCPSVLVRRR